MKLKWKVLAIIYVVEFLLIVYILHLIGLMDSIKVVSDVVVGLIVGIVVTFASVFIGWGVIRNFDKKDITENLLSEVEVNQRLLQPISDSVSKALDSNDFSDDDKLPNELIFSRNVYSALSGKLGLISKEKRDKTHQYYSELKHIEEKYKKLNIQGCSYPFLVYLQLREIGVSKTPTPGWYEIEEYLRNTKKVNDLGTELIIDLKEETGIKPLDSHPSVIASNEPLILGHLQTRYPDIRKLWFEECPELKSRISEDEKIIKEYVKNKYSKLEHIFQTQYFYPDKTVKTEAELVFELLDEFEMKCPVPEKYKIENCKEIIETIKNDKPLYRAFGTLNTPSINFRKFFIFR